MVATGIIRGFHIERTQPLRGLYTGTMSQDPLSPLPIMIGSVPLIRRGIVRIWNVHGRFSALYASVELADTAYDTGFEMIRETRKLLRTNAMLVFIPIPRQGGGATRGPFTVAERGGPM